MNKYNFVKAHVLSDSDIAVIKDEDNFTLEDLRQQVNSYDFTWDYAETALIDLDRGHVIIWDDNIHGNPDGDIAMFLYALGYAGVDYEVSEDVILKQDMKIYTGGRG